MATEIGLDTSYPITIPSATDTADIQSALRFISYGIAGTPTSNAQITSNSIFGKMSLLAPKAAPAFTGNGSIAGNFQIGGNLTVVGSIDTLSSTNALFKDKTLVLSSESTTDSASDGAGIQVSGSTAKTFLFANGLGWSSNQNINLATGRTFKINSTDVLSSTSVLGILGTNIAKKDSTNAFTAANTFSGGTQTINGLTIDTSGGISGPIVSNEWTPLVAYKPVDPITYPLSSSVKLGSSFRFTGYIPDGFGGVIQIDFYNLIYRLNLVASTQTPPLLENQIIFVPTSEGTIPFKVLSTAPGSIVAQTDVNIFSDPSTSISVGSPAQDFYSETSIQEWKYGGVNGTVAAQITTEGAVEALNGFRDIGKTYHTNAAVPRAELNVKSGNIFSVNSYSNPADISGISADGTSISYSYSPTSGSYSVGDLVTVTGLAPTAYNVTNATIISEGNGFFSVAGTTTTAPTDQVGTANVTTWGSTTASSSTSAVTNKWHPAIPADPSISQLSGMTYDFSTGLFSVTQTGTYSIQASLTVSSTAVSGTMFGIYVVNQDGGRTPPTQVSNIGVSNITGNLSTVMYLYNGQKIGIAVRTASAAAVAIKNTDGSFRLSAHLVG
jgi:hypothetical protein